MIAVGGGFGACVIADWSAAGPLLKPHNQVVVVLVDPPRWPAHGRLWCHLVSDHSLTELHALAAAVGIPARGFDHDHYDVPAERYDEVIAAGAVPVDSRELLRRLTAAGLRRRKRDRRVIGAEPARPSGTP